jgi:hypothetical protein
MSGKQKSTGGEALLFLFGMLLGAALMHFVIKNPEEFIIFCKKAEEQLKLAKGKPLEEMSLEDLDKLLKTLVKKEKYEDAAIVKKIIDYKKQNPKLKP